MARRRAVEVLVLGGGPAGAVAAAELARRGVPVAALERSRYESPRIGETLPPAATPLLHRLGVWEAFTQGAHLPAPGIVSVWADEQANENDFVFNPYGTGWHLDRAVFDRMLAESAAKAGATVVRAARVRTCRRAEDERWTVTYQGAGAVHDVGARFLIDATGRSAWLARQQGANRLVLDRLVGIIGLGERSRDDEPRTILEATAEGWWYAARLPNRRVVASFMTDADLLPRGKEALKRFWQERLRDAPRTSAVWSQRDNAGALQVVFAGTERLDRIGGPGWLAVGDAAMAFDPLSSQGILTAMESGWRAAETISDLLAGNTQSVAGYTAWLEAELAAYLKSYVHYYRRVTRWPDSVFWRRRSGAAQDRATPSLPEP